SRPRRYENCSTRPCASGCHAAIEPSILGTTTSFVTAAALDTYGLSPLRCPVGLHEDVLHLPMRPLVASHRGRLPQRSHHQHDGSDRADDDHRGCDGDDDEPEDT